MDRVEIALLIRRTLDDYADLLAKVKDRQVERIYQDETGHYELMLIGWEGWRRIHGCILHIDLIDGKIWIQQDGTEYGIAADFLEAGVTKEEIVLGFQPPGKRPYTGFAVD
ncbi:MAG: XisI protein [Chthonomonadaceae bacterium]|nr:XisI protein [Chthonomonadaceae bacterium]